MIWRVSSKLGLDAHGRLIVVVTASCDAGLRVGETFRVLGNDLPSVARGFHWLGEKRSRLATPTEQADVQRGSPRLPGG